MQVHDLIVEAAIDYSADYLVLNPSHVAKHTASLIMMADTNIIICQKS